MHVIVTHSTGCSNNSVGHKVEGQSNLLEDIPKELDDLQSKHVLPHIISHLVDASLPYTLLLQP